MENINIRLEKPEDYREVENLVRETFWDLFKPGCDEHLLLHKLRSVPAFVPELDFVALDGDKIVGQIVYSKAKVVNDQNQEFEVLCMGPLGVLPSYQSKGVGALLMKRSMDVAKSLGYKGVIIYGHPGYYHRFGFKNAEVYNIQTSDGGNFDAFMALELSENSLAGITGRFIEDPVFHLKEDELALFEANFPYKEKHVTDTQLQ